MKIQNHQYSNLYKQKNQEKIIIYITRDDRDLGSKSEFFNEYQVIVNGQHFQVTSGNQVWVLEDNGSMWYARKEHGAEGMNHELMECGYFSGPEESELACGRGVKLLLFDAGLGYKEVLIIR